MSVEDVIAKNVQSYSSTRRALVYVDGEIGWVAWRNPHSAKNTIMVNLGARDPQCQTVELHSLSSLQYAMRDLKYMINTDDFDIRIFLQEVTISECSTIPDIEDKFNYFYINELVTPDDKDIVDMFWQLIAVD